MRPTRQILLRDALIGLYLVLAPGSLLADDAEPLLVLPALAVALGWAAIQYLAEHGTTPARVAGLEDNPLVLALLVFAGALLAVLLLVLWPATVNWFAAGFLGLGIGLLGYRFVYGVLRPIPERPLDRVREGSA